MILTIKLSDLRLTLGLTALVCSMLLSCAPRRLGDSRAKDSDSTAVRSPVDALVAKGSAEGFARAEVVREFVFPKDHGPHPDFQTEWWYVTASLETEEGQRFGIQWTIFRRALEPTMVRRSSQWASRQLFMGHVAITDVDGALSGSAGLSHDDSSDSEGARHFLKSRNHQNQGARHFSAERFSRAGNDLAGAEIRPFRVWLEDWRAESNATEDIFPLRLTAKVDANETAAGIPFSIDLELAAGKPMVLQGDRGLSWKHEGGASYYYSFTRLGVEGSLSIDHRAAKVRGDAWFDREWSTSTLSDEQTGWDWFALQLDDGRDLMFYRLRQADESAHPMSAGVLVATDGSSQALTREQIDLKATSTWASPETGAAYPSAWRLLVPDHALELNIQSLVPDQELDITFRYFEGAVGVEGLSDGVGIAGRGYVELVGYAP